MSSSPQQERILDVDEVMVFEGAYKQYEGPLHIDSAAGGGGGGALFRGVCGEHVVAVNKETTVVKTGRGQYRATMLGRPLMFILPEESTDTSLDFIEAVLAQVLTFDSHSRCGAAASCVDDGGSVKHLAGPTQASTEEVGGGGESGGGARGIVGGVGGGVGGGGGEEGVLSAIGRHASNLTDSVLMRIPIGGRKAKE